ncbi:lipase family protein [Psychromicrobium lacuslunae]|nr:lipase family protein [Psychromicrobium lacuslunae]
MIRKSLVMALAFVTAALSALVFAPLASAATPPNWSGLDVADYSGEIPAKAGTLIKQVPLDPSVSLTAAGQAYRFLYSTSNQHSSSAVSTAELFLPQGKAPDGGWPIIAWAHGTVGLGDNCTPSALPANERQSFYLPFWLAQGYAVVGTDYAGLGTPGLMSYLNGKVEAHNLVDSVKAVQQMGLPLSRKWALVGQSQGAGAAMNGARYATEFGPELDFRGVVATGTPAHIELFAQLGGPLIPPVPITKNLTAYLIYIVAGFRDARPDLKIDDILTPFGKQLVQQAETSCYLEFADLVAGKTIGAMFKKPILSIPGVYQALSDYMQTPDNGYDRPIFLGQGIFDIDVPAPLSISLAAGLAFHQQDYELHIYPSDHTGTVYAAANDAATFMKRIMR